MTLQKQIECNIYERIQRIVEEYRVTFGVSPEGEWTSLQTVKKGHTLLPVLLRLLTLRGVSDRHAASMFYGALNFLVWQTLVERHLPAQVVESAVGVAGVSIIDRRFARELVCDAIAVSIAEDRFVHPDDSRFPYVARQEDRRTIAAGAYYASVHLVCKMGLASGSGGEKTQRLRFLAGIQILHTYYRSPKTLTAWTTKLRKGISSKQVAEASKLFSEALSTGYADHLLRAPGRQDVERPRLVCVQ